MEVQKDETGHNCLKRPQPSCERDDREEKGEKGERGRGEKRLALAVIDPKGLLGREVAIKHIDVESVEGATETNKENQENQEHQEHQEHQENQENQEREEEEEEKQPIREVKWTCLGFAEYMLDIIAFQKELEKKRRPRVNYMSKQKEITASMRGILVDWLVDVVAEFNHHSETLFLTVNLIDRFLSKAQVARGKLQLVGVCALFIAAKFEEVKIPSIQDLAYICDDTYRLDDIRNTEYQILRLLRFETCIASPLTFCNNFIKAVPADPSVESLAHYLCELTLQDYRFVRYLPSEIAASALCLSLHSFGLPCWDSTLELISGYKLETLLQDCLPSLFLLFANASKIPHKAIREKYLVPERHNVATLCPPAALPSLPVRRSERT